LALAAKREMWWSRRRKRWCSPEGDVAEDGTGHLLVIKTRSDRNNAAIVGREHAQGLGDGGGITPRRTHVI
jgi:hypothetical protein